MRLEQALAIVQTVIGEAGERRVGAAGVSGLAGVDDDALARRALEVAGLESR